MKQIHILSLLICVLTGLLPVRAQQHILPSVSKADTAIRISVLTCAPGADIYELEGHSGLRMQYGGNDITANWGLFDFDSPDFVYRFVKGETDYCVGAMPTEYFLMQYRNAGRKVTEQSLSLTPEEARYVIQLVDENLRPENRVYRYNYVMDNCATRVRDIIEKATGKEIIFNPYDNTTTTFRNEMRRFHKNYPWYQFGIDLALGSGIDRKISVRETGFAPVTMSDILQDARINDSEIVSQTNVLSQGDDKGVALGPTPWYLTPVATMIVLLVISLILTRNDIRKRKVSLWFDALLFTLYSMAGLIITFLVFVSVHEATSPNWLLLWLSPLCLIVPLFQWSKRTRKTVTIYHYYNIAATLILTLIFFSGIQSANPAFYPAMTAGLIRSLNYLFINCKNEKQQ